MSIIIYKVTIKTFSSASWIISWVRTSNRSCSPASLWTYDWFNISLSSLVTNPSARLLELALEPSTVYTKKRVHFCYWRNSSLKNNINIYSPSSHPIYEVCFLIRTAEMLHYIICSPMDPLLCGEWVPPEFKQMIKKKYITIIHTLQSIKKRAIVWIQDS